MMQLAEDPGDAAAVRRIDEIAAFFDRAALALQPLIDLAENQELERAGIVAHLEQRSSELADERLAHQGTTAALAAERATAERNAEKLAKEREQLSKERTAHKLTKSEVDAQREAAERYRSLLDRALRRPWLTLKDQVSHKALAGLSAATRQVAPRASRRFGRSSAKRDPLRFANPEKPQKSGEATRTAAIPATVSRDTRIGTSENWVPRRVGPPPRELPARLVAFYLPQFHPIPENDGWWGAGFTEWRNVTRAEPAYPGHFQPHLPADLGFYDLRLPQVMHQQIDLARQYGVSAFCFYFYWFSGRTLLEQPLRQFLLDPDMNIEFCLCWANENWSRRWDGKDQEILIAQDHSPDDDLAFIAHVSHYLRDRRCIRIDGRPLLLVYRPDLLPDSRATALRWRTWCRENGVGEIYLAYVQTAERVDPAGHGFDAAVEFPPNNTAPPNITETVEGLRPDFSGTVYDWTVYPSRSAGYELSDYKLFRGTNPSWDNTARRGAGGTIFHGSSPSGFRTWLENAIVDTVHRFPAPDERLVFVNAWNEWAEGAHLEPDLRYGHAYLQATYDALQSSGMRLRGERRRRIAIVSHDAYLHGAQFLALNLGQFLRDAFHFEVDFILLGPGELMPRFRDVGRVTDLTGMDLSGPDVQELLNRLRSDGCEVVIANTVVSGRLTPALKSAGFRIVSLVHELPGVIRDNGLESAARALADGSDHVVFPAEPVRSAFGTFASVPDHRAHVRPQGLFKPPVSRDPAARDRARARLRLANGLSEDAPVVLALGYSDARKGIDLFTEAAISLCRADPDVTFLWGGNPNTDLGRAQVARVAEERLADRIRFIGFVDDLEAVLLGADVFVLSSREDPFPSVLLDALDAALPVVAFDGAGGFCDLLREVGGVLAPEMTARALASSIATLLGDRALSESLGAKGRLAVERDFSFRAYVFDLLRLAFPDIAPVSVVVPNYNYLAHIEERLASIAAQSYPVREVIVLDDASTDGSAAWLAENLQRLIPGARLVINARNSGAVFHQWRHGAELSTGEFLWIAEADDVAEPDFLSTVLGGFSDPAVVLSYAQSCAINARGRRVMDDYLSYVSDISTTRWRASYVNDGATEIREALAIKNTIPNVSAVVFRRDSLVMAMETLRARLDEVSVSGDWLIYLQMLAKGGAISFFSDVLNQHRRHDDSTTSRARGRRLAREIVEGQAFAAGLVELPKKTRQLAASYCEEIKTSASES
jgi:glycosyltransferase involved in cell wall biosynthesis